MSAAKADTNVVSKTIEDLLAVTPEASMVKYRAVARRQQACLDLFSERLSTLPEGRRFAAPVGRGESAAERVGNSMRIYALGAIACLGRRVGLIDVELYGKGKGRTMLTELHDLHCATVQNAMASFEALCEDGGEVGQLVAERFRLLVESAQEEIRNGGAQ